MWWAWHIEELHGWSSTMEPPCSPLKLRFSYPTVSWGVSEPQHNKCDDYKPFRLNIIFSLTFVHNRKCLYLLEKQKNATTQEIPFICLCKMTSSAPHICSQSHSREQLIVVLFHESKVACLTTIFFKCGTFLTWQQILVSAEEKLPM